MTTPGGVPNLPIGALTVETLAQKLQDQSAAAIRNRAGEQVPSIFGQSTGGDILSDLSPFGILTNIWAGVNSLIATSDPADIQGPEDLPPLLLDFIEGLPFVGQFVQLLEAITGNYDGTDPSLNGIQDFLGPLFQIISTIGQNLADFLKWVWDSLGGPLVDVVLKPIFTWLGWLWRLFANITPNPEPTGPGAEILVPIFKWIDWLWELFGEAVQAVLKPIFTWLNWLWRLFANTPGPNPEPTGPGADILVPLFKWLDWLWEQFGAAVESALKPIFEFLHWLFIGLPAGDPPPSTGNSIADQFLQPVFMVIKTAWDLFVAAAARLGGTAQQLLTNLVSWVSWFWNGVAGGFGGFGGTVETVLKPLITWLNDLWALFATISGNAAQSLTELFTALSRMIKGYGSADGWLRSIPLVGPLVSVITGKTVADGVPMTLDTLGSWARDVLTNKTPIPADLLQGTLPTGVLSSIPVSNIAFDTPNLLSQGDFGTAATISSADGWSWDSSTNNSGSGGCAKVVCNGTARRLYSNQVIKVVAGDKLNLSAYVKTSADFAGSSSCIELVLVPFAGTSRYTVNGSAVNVVFKTRGASPNSFSLMTGSSASGTAPWTVPSGVTSVRVRLSVTSAATAGSVWFDDIDLHKSGLLSGDWMAGIIGTVAEDFTSITNNIIQAIKGALPGAGANPIYGVLTSLQSIFQTMFNTLSLPSNLASNPLLETAIPGLQASKITGGAFGSDRIGQDAVGNYQIADDAVDTAQIRQNAVTSDEIKSGAVTGGVDGELATYTVTSNNVYEVDGSKIKSGKVNIDRLPTDSIGAAINPTEGSGAMLIRNASNPMSPRALNDRAFTPDAFFNELAKSSTDIQCLTTTGAVGTGVRADYAGAFKVTLNGWYLVEIAYRMNTIFGDMAYVVTPVLYRGFELDEVRDYATRSAFPGTGIINRIYVATDTNVSYRWSTSTSTYVQTTESYVKSRMQKIYKVGSDATFLTLPGTTVVTRYIQNSFIVYLNANEIVRAGTDIGYSGSNANPPLIGGESNVGTSGAETYFSISLLNRSYA